MRVAVDTLVGVFEIHTQDELSVLPSRVCESLVFTKVCATVEGQTAVARGFTCDVGLLYSPASEAIVVASRVMACEVLGHTTFASGVMSVVFGRAIAWWNRLPVEPAILNAVLAFFV